MTYDVRNPDPGLGQAQNCGRVKPVNDPNPPSLEFDLKKNMHRSISFY